MAHLLKLKYALGTLECVYLASTSVPLRPRAVQMPNIALIEKKLITVCVKAVLEHKYGFQYFTVMRKL